MTSTGRRRTGRVLTALLGSLLLMLPSACTQDDEQDRTPAEVLAAAKKRLDDTSGVTLSLTGERLPDGVDGLLEATGVGTHAPAFDGDLTVLVDNLSLKVPVVAVDGQVFAKLPFDPKFVEIDPADYGAPDPAALMSTEGGISSWLTAAEGVEEGEASRNGSRVLTSYSGTLPGEAVVSVIPSADETADFPCTFLVDEDGLLDSAEVVGPFYAGKDEVEYTVTLSDYGTEKDITKP